VANGSCYLFFERHVYGEIEDTVISTKSNDVTIQLRAGYTSWRHGGRTGPGGSKVPATGDNTDAG